MARLPFMLWSELQGPGTVDLNRGTPRKVPHASDKRARFGEHLDRTRLCESELGIHFVALCCLLVLVARKRSEGLLLTSRVTVDAFLRQEEGFTVSDGLLELRRHRLAVEAGRDGNASYWSVTAEGERRVMAWSGWDRMQAEAAE